MLTLISGLLIVFIWVLVCLWCRGILYFDDISPWNMFMCNSLAVPLQTCLSECLHTFSDGDDMCHQIRFILFCHMVFPLIWYTCNHACMLFSLCVCVCLNPCKSLLPLIKGAICSFYPGGGPHEHPAQGVAAKRSGGSVHLTESACGKGGS